MRVYFSRLVWDVARQSVETAGLSALAEFMCPNLSAYDYIVIAHLKEKQLSWIISIGNIERYFPPKNMSIMKL